MCVQRDVNTSHAAHYTRTGTPWHKKIVNYGGCVLNLAVLVLDPV
jgi:hypothetical protein